MNVAVFSVELKDLINPFLKSNIDFHKYQFLLISYIVYNLALFVTIHIFTNDQSQAEKSDLFRLNTLNTLWKIVTYIGGSLIYAIKNFITFLILTIIRYGIYEIPITYINYFISAPDKLLFSYSLSILLFAIILSNIITYIILNDDCPTNFDDIRNNLKEISFIYTISVVFIQALPELGKFLGLAINDIFVDINFVWDVGSSSSILILSIISLFIFIWLVLSGGVIVRKCIAIKQYQILGTIGFKKIFVNCFYLLALLSLLLLCDLVIGAIFLASLVLSFMIGILPFSLDLIFVGKK